MLGSGVPNDPSLDAFQGVAPGTTSNLDLWQPSGAGATGFMSGTGTGQAGVTPISGTSGGLTGGIADAFNSLWDWLNAPMTEPLSFELIFLIVGGVLAAIFLWNLILYHIRIAAETI